MLVLDGEQSFSDCCRDVDLILRTPLLGVGTFYGAADALGGNGQIRTRWEFPRPRSRLANAVAVNVG